MRPAMILTAAREAGVTLTARAGVVYAAPSGRLPAELVDEIRAHKEELVAALSHPPCPSCGAPVDAPESVLCGPCYAARRGPGRVLPFDPDRRRRTEARLAARPCGTCGAVAWRVSGRGDATCGRCFPDSSSAPARPLAGRPVSPGAPGAGRGGVSGGGVA